MKERLKEAAGSFFIITTLICIAIFVLGSVFRPEERYGYEIMIYPVIYGAMTCIPGLIMYTKKELSVKQMIIREIIQLLIIIAIILFLVFGGLPLTRETIILRAAVALSVVIIYILVCIIRWRLDMNTAVRMTEDLEKWKLKNENDCF